MYYIKMPQINVFSYQGQQQDNKNTHYKSRFDMFIGPQIRYIILI